MDSDRANWFLKPRNEELSKCRYAWEYSEEAKLSSDSWKRDKSALTNLSVKEECCAEGCNTEEMDENLYNLWYSSYAVVSMNICSLCSQHLGNLKELAKLLSAYSLICA